jgi:hypothetical protein
VEAIGELEPGDSPDGSGQNPVVEGADMMIGVWDWGRVEEHLRYGWRSAEVLTPQRGEPPSKWHLRTRKKNGEVAHLDVCKGAGIEKSEITHAAAAMAGFPRNANYRIQVKGRREDSDFQAKGVDIIRRMSTKNSGCGQLPVGQRPDVLLGMKDAKRLEGYLRAGWCEDRVTPGGLPRRNRTASASLEERLASSKAEAAAEKLARPNRVQPHQAARVVRLQAYADDTTLRPQGAPKPNPPEARKHKPRRKEKEKEKWTYVQRIRTQAEGKSLELRVMFDIDTPHTLISHAAAARAALAPRGGKMWVMSPDSGEMDESSCRYNVPLVDYQGNAHVFRARGVDYTIYTKERNVPPNAATVFTEMEGEASRAHLAAGMVDMIVGRNNEKWHPREVCDSWQAEDNLTLMRSEFPPRYIARETASTKRRV